VFFAQAPSLPVEASALRHAGANGLRGPTPLLRIQSDERLVALTRHGNQAAYEALVARYQARLIAFCRHMLGSREDAEDVLQEVFAAAFNAMIADERPINVRPWLYRIARNRSLNHLRRVQAIGVDSMDVHFSENGASTADKVHRREEFRLLVQDVQGLPETQRTALLLREIDALSYEQIAEAMETTVPSVKSLLVRARVSLAESAEARHLTCEEVRDELGEVAEGLRRTSPPVRRHVRVCDRCAAFRKHLRDNNRALAAIFPVGPLLLLKKLLLANLGTTASAGSSAAAAAGASASAAGAGGALSAGMGAVGAKAAAGLAAAAIVTAGAVEVDHVRHKPVSHKSVVAATVPASTVPAEPRVIASQPQPTAAPAPVHRSHKPASTPKADKDAKSAATREAPAPKPAAPAEAKKPTTPAPAPVPPPQQASATTTLPAQQAPQAQTPASGADQPVSPAPPPAGPPVADQPAQQAPPPPPPATQQPPPADTPPPPADGTTTTPPPPADPPAADPPPPAQ
jgi:RNA polymerase sigma factor (sigma-70 family)